MRVLVHEWVTGGGLSGRPLPASLAAEGRAMRDAVADDFSTLGGVEVVATLDDRFEERDRRWETVAVREGGEREALAGLAAGCEFTVLIAPETGGVLRLRAEWVDAAGGHSLGPTPAAIALTGDKRRLADHLVAQEIATAPAVPLGVLRRTFGVPHVVKPRDGAGCLDTFLVLGPDDPRLAGLTDEAWIAQPFAEGTPMSACFLVGRDGGAALIGVGRQEVACVGGAFHYRGGTIPLPVAIGLGTPLDAVRSVPGLRGFVGVDFLHDATTGRTSVLEINPRVTTSFVGWRRLLGRGTLARAWLDSAEGGPSADSLFVNTPGRSLRFAADGTIKDPT